MYPIKCIFLKCLFFYVLRHETYSFAFYTFFFSMNAHKECLILYLIVNVIFSRRYFWYDLALHFEIITIVLRYMYLSRITILQTILIVNRHILMILFKLLGLCLHYSCVVVFPLYTFSLSCILEKKYMYVIKERDTKPIDTWRRNNLV